MTMPSATEYQQTGPLPDLHAFDNERLKVFWILADEARRNPDGLLSSYAIAQRLEREHRVDVPRHRVDAILRKERKTVLRRVRGATEYWKLMRAGEIELETPSDVATFIDPQKAFTSRLRVYEILSGLAGHLRFCDPYVDSSVLESLASCSKATTIKLLTSKIHSLSFGADLAAFNKEFQGRIQVRSVSKQKLHDRYIFHNSGMILFGASLKDIGKAPSFVVALGPDLTEAVSDHFENAWNSASPVE
jgi:hypothetical protein